MSTEKGYNGHANYATWATALWIDNDEGMYREPERMAEECAERIRHGEGNPYAEDFDQKLRMMLADALREWADETLFADQPDTGLMADLLTSAIQDIDWNDLARHYMSDLDLEALKRGDDDD